MLGEIKVAQLTMLADVIQMADLEVDDRPF